MQHQCCTMLTFTLAYTTFIKYSWNHTPKMWHNYLFSIIKCYAAACDFHQIHNAKYWGMQLTTAILKKWNISKCLTEVLLHLPFSSPFPYCTLLWITPLATGILVLIIHQVRSQSSNLGMHMSQIKYTFWKPIKCYYSQSNIIIAVMALSNGLKLWHPEPQPFGFTALLWFLL